MTYGRLLGVLLQFWRVCVAYVWDACGKGVARGLRCVLYAPGLRSIGEFCVCVRHVSCECGACLSVCGMCGLREMQAFACVQCNVGVGYTRFCVVLVCACGLCRLCPCVWCVCSFCVRHMCGVGSIALVCVLCM